MLRVLRAVLVAVLFAGAAAAAELKPYVNEDMASDAARLAETLKTMAGKVGAQTAGKTPEDLRKGSAAATAAEKFDLAAALAAAAATVAPKDPANWLAFANVAIKADDTQADNRWMLVTQGAAAAYAAYERATRPDTQALALATLGDLQARHSVWRGALDAYKASLDRRDNPDVRKTYETLREQYGFRILDYKVDNEIEQSARLLHLLGAARAQDGFLALRGGVGRLQHGDLERGPADLRRGPEARRALRHRAATGPAVGGGREPPEGGRLRDLRPRPLAPGPFRRQGLRPAARGAGGRAARHRQHVEGLRRDLPHRRPQPARGRQRRRFPEAHRHRPRASHRQQRRPEGLERLDGRGERTQQGRRHRISGAQGGGPARSRRLSRHREALEAKDPGLRRAGIHAARDAVDGRLRPRPHRHLRKRRRPRVRSVAGLRGPGRGRRAQARRAQQRGAGGQDHRPRRARGFRSGARARQGRIGAGAPRRDARRRLQFPQPRAERLRPDRPRRRRARRALGPRRLPLHRARRLPLRRDGVRDRAASRRRGRRPPRPAADPRRQAPRRGRVQARDGSRRGSGRARPRRSAAGGLGARKMAHRGLCRSEGRSDRRGRVPARGLHPRAARFLPSARSAGHHARRAGRALARRALPLRRAGDRPRRHRGDPRAGRRRRSARGLPRLCRGPRRRRLHHRRDPVHGQGDDRRQGSRRAVRRPAGGDVDATAGGEADRRRRRTRRADGRAHRHAAHPGERRRGRRQEDFRRVDFRRGSGDVRGDRGRAGRRARRAQGRGMVALPGDQRLSVVQRRRTLELRAGQVVEARRERRRRHRRRRACENLGARRAGGRTVSTSRRSTARRRAWPSTSAGRARRAPTRPTTSWSPWTRPLMRLATR